MAGSLNGHGVISIRPEIDGQPEPARFRYARESFRRNLLIAISLTALICGLIWLLLGIYGVRHMNLLTALAGIVFFAFISARMLSQYYRNEIVLSVQPTGLYDGRISQETLPWDTIKELVLVRREQEYSLRVVLWPAREDLLARTHEVELTALEGGSEKILEAINHYMPIRMER